MARIRLTNGIDRETIESVFGEPGNEILALDGDDVVSGGRGNDTIRGGNGNDDLFGGGILGFGLQGAGNDSLDGGLGDDTLRDGIGNDTLDGGEGNDRLSDTSGSNTLLGGIGNDTLEGKGLAQFLNGGDGADFLFVDTRDQDISTLEGGAGNDTLTADNKDRSAQVMRGGDGDDELRGIGGNDTLEGGNGNDLLDAGGGGGGSFDVLDGGDGDDTLRGSGGDISRGGAGNDSLTSSLGADTLIGGTGNDTMTTGIATDSPIFIGVDPENGAGRGEQDVIQIRGRRTGFRGQYIAGDNNNVYYNDGDPNSDGLGDFLTVDGFDARQDVIQLKGTFQDYVSGSARIDGRSGAAIFLDTTRNGVFDATDELIVFLPDTPVINNLQAGGFRFVGETNDDDFVNPEAGQLVEGTNENERLFGSPGDDTIRGFGGEDDLFGLDGNDNIDGGDSGDEILGGLGNDTLRGGNSTDNIFGQEGNDQIFGGADNDRFASDGLFVRGLFGGEGNDTIRGEGGADVLIGDQGNDSLEGGLDNDVLFGAGLGAKSAFSGFSTSRGTGEIDRASGGAGEDQFFLGDGQVVFYDDGNALSDGRQDAMIITDFNRSSDTIVLTGSPNDYVVDQSPVPGEAGVGIFLNSGPNTRDELIAVVKGATLTGANRFNLQSDYVEFLEIPSFSGSSKKDTFKGDGQGGILEGRGGSDRLLGQGGDDVILGGTGRDTGVGGIGADSIDGGQGADLLRGNGGADLLYGSQGRDTLIGGIGQDTFIIAPNTGLDTIRDFKDGIDSIGLSTGLRFEDLIITQENNDTIISTGSTRIASLQGVQAGLITEEDFVVIDGVYSQIMDTVIPVVI